ncbi:MAG: hypothetical protein NZ740_03025 [Kiritimatiellae bacterium]|nr:hypothetical protein [Kiritimatiellia bacterium]MDW8458065.1 hypothetical protein [Verrucomicrobiota bacterium]
MGRASSLIRIPAAIMVGVASFGETRAAAQEANCFASALATAGGAPALRGEAGWLFLASELRFLAAGEFWGDAAADAGRAANPAHRDPLEPIDDFNRQLRDVDISLLVVPVPPKALIYPAMLGCTRDEARPSLERLRRFYGLLRERGVDVLDLTETFLAPEALAEGPLYCRTDTHWTGIGIRLAAERIADWLRAKGLAAAEEGGSAWSVEPREISITGDLGRLMGEDAREIVPVWRVAGPDGQPPRPDPSSPILLMGDSHVLVFSEGGDLHDVGSGLPEQLTARIGAPVDVLGVRGSGATTSRISLIRRIRSAPDFYKVKKAIVWCFAAREFTEADAWRFVPLPVQ